MAPKESKAPKDRRPLKKRRWRVAVFLVVLALASLFFQFVIEAPISIPDSFLALPFLSLWQPLFGLPLIAFSVWWVLDRRIPLWMLIVPFTLIAYCGRLMVGGPPQRTVEELEGISDEGELQFKEVQSGPRYKRKIFPPFKK